MRVIILFLAMFSFSILNAGRQEISLFRRIRQTELGIIELRSNFIRNLASLCHIMNKTAAQIVNALGIDTSQLSREVMAKAKLSEEEFWVIIVKLQQAKPKLTPQWPLDYEKFIRAYEMIDDRNLPNELGEKKGVISKENFPSSGFLSYRNYLNVLIQSQDIIEVTHISLGPNGELYFGAPPKTKVWIIFGKEKRRAEVKVVFTKNIRGNVSAIEVIFGEDDIRKLPTLHLPTNQQDTEPGELVETLYTGMFLEDLFREIDGLSQDGRNPEVVIDNGRLDEWGDFWITREKPLFDLPEEYKNAEFRLRLIKIQAGTPQYPRAKVKAIVTLLRDGSGNPFSPSADPPTFKFIIEYNEKTSQVYETRPGN